MSNAGTKTRVWVAGSQVLLSLLVLVGIWGLLPARYGLVDGLGTLVGLALAASAYGLFAEQRWGLALAKRVALFPLALGCATVTALAWTAAHLIGLYGPVGAGGSALMATVAALVLPYLIGVPLLQLRWLRRLADAAHA
jgi:hypothetical protein